MQDNKLEAEIEGADAPLLNTKITTLFSQGPVCKQASSAGPRKAPPAQPQQSAETTARIRTLLASAPVLLFMKGTPEAPRCGFSAKTVAALRNAGVEFSTFDILTDDTIRQGLKVSAGPHDVMHCDHLAGSSTNWKLLKRRHTLAVPGPMHVCTCAYIKDACCCLTMTTVKRISC